MEDAGSGRVGTSSSYRGVYKRKSGKWASDFRVPGNKGKIWLGSFDTSEMAATAYDVAALHFRRDDARLNFPAQAKNLPRPTSSSKADVLMAVRQAVLRLQVAAGGHAGTSSSYRGIWKRTRGWESEIRVPGENRRIWLGRFDTQEKAATAYDVAARYFRRDDARLNFPAQAKNLPRPTSSSAADVRMAAQEAALPPREAPGTAPGVGGGSAAMNEAAPVTVSLQPSTIATIRDYPLGSPTMWMPMAEPLSPMGNASLWEWELLRDGDGQVGPVLWDPLSFSST